MPLYEYECAACGHRFEVIQSFTDAPIETCKKCGAAVHKLLSAPAIHFKGTGWYITDYGKMKGGDSGHSSSSDAPKSTDAAKTTDSAKPADTPKSTDTGSSTPSGGSTPTKTD